ncbi:hypothetical protein BDE36_3441 [Arcticibacter tournemirensis]|nr:hypothetical protein BDE36_3441 [Arcticibacter tournemirensis]
MRLVLDILDRFLVIYVLYLHTLRRYLYSMRVPPALIIEYITYYIYLKKLTMKSKLITVSRNKTSHLPDLPSC